MIVIKLTIFFHVHNKFKWNLMLQTGSLTAVFWTFYDLKDYTGQCNNTTNARVNNLEEKLV